MTEAPASPPPTASVRRRLAAHVLDSVLVAVVGIGVAWLVAAALPALSVSDRQDGTLQLVVDPLRLAVQALAVATIGAVYFGWSWSEPRGATLGQRALGLRVLDVTGASGLGTGHALARWAATGIPLGVVAAAVVEIPVAWLAVAALIALWTFALLVSTWRSPRRRGLHDRLAGSVVVRA